MRSKSYGCSDGGHLCDWCKGLLIIYTILLGISLGYQPSLISINLAICVEFDLVNPFASYGLLLCWKICQDPSLILEKSIVLFIQGMFLLRDLHCILEGGRLIKFHYFGHECIIALVGPSIRCLLITCRFSEIGRGTLRNINDNCGSGCVHYVSNFLFAFIPSGHCGLLTDCVGKEIRCIIGTNG